MFTSCGDLSRLNILEPFRPSAGNKILTVEDIDFSIRFLLPSISCSFFEYDASLRMRFYCGAKYSTEEKMQVFTTVVKEWISVILE